ELHLADHRRLHPGRALDLPELRIGDRRRVANERPQEVQHPPEQLVGETRADLPDPAELALQIGPYEQRPERARSSALSGRPAEDHAVLPVQQLDLPPVRRAPALEIPRPQLLRDDALE